MHWAGRLDKNSTPAHKAALITVLGLIAVASGITFYVLGHPFSAAPQSVIHWTPQMGAIAARPHYG